MNSWGDQWSDKCRFRVQPGTMKVTFYDVFWYEQDLTPHEKILFQTRGREAFDRFCEIKRGIDGIFEEEKDKFCNLGNSILQILRFCNQLSKNSDNELTPNMKEVNEIISPISQSIDDHQNDDESNFQVIENADHSIDLMGVHFTARQIELLVTFMAGIFTSDRVTQQLQEMLEHFWRQQ